jgi:hypothetical protein
MKKILMTIALLIIINYLNAQKIVGGEWSIGPRFGGSSGISLNKHFASNKAAFEFLAANSFDSEVKGFSIAALLEKLAPLNGNGQFSALVGGGINFNFKDETKFGVSGILGFDWRLKKLPITMQLDWMPTYYFVNERYFSGVNAAFTIRYVLNRKKFESRK